MTEEEIIQFATSLPGVDFETAAEGAGAPEIAWGDTFFFYNPGGDIPVDHRFPFATIVTKDYTGFDTASQLDRPGVYRLNISVGRRAFEQLFGYPPAAHAEHDDQHDYTAADRLIPHPVYAVQGWASIVNPGEATEDQVRALLTQAHAREAERRQRQRREPSA